MNPAHPLIQALGWTLLHSLWQGAVVAMVLRLVLGRFRRFGSEARYVVSVLALIAMVGWPVATFCGEDPATWKPAWWGGGDGGRASETVPLRAGPSSDPGTSHAVPGSVPVAGSWFQVVGRCGAVVRQGLSERLPAAFPWVVGGWLAGVVGVSLRFCAGWGLVQRMRRAGIPPEDVAWTNRFERLKRRVGISRPVRLLVSAGAAVPMVIGWAKPVVLVPAGLFLGLSVPQLEAILIHELAHVRRHDYLANLLQAVVEAALFYHPAVWWVSAQVRREREHCCDDVAALMSGSAVGYARALLALEEFRGDLSSPAWAVSAAGGSLMHRVRRLLGAAPRDSGSLVPWAMGMTCMLAAVLGFSATARPAEPEPPRGSSRIRNGFYLAASDKDPSSTKITLAAGEGGTLQQFNIAGRPVVEPGGIESVRMLKSDAGAWEVRVRLTEAAGTALGRALKETAAPGSLRAGAPPPPHRIVIVVDGKCVAAPRAMGEVGRDVIIAGRFSEDEARRLAEALRRAEPNPR